MAKIKTLGFLEGLLANNASIEQQLRVDVANEKIKEIENPTPKMFSYYKSRTEEPNKTPLNSTGRFIGSLKPDKRIGLISTDKKEKVEAIKGKYPDYFKIDVKVLRTIIKKHIKNLIKNGTINSVAN